MDNDPWKDLAKLGYKLNMKVIYRYYYVFDHV
jgi:hypothetical protein